MLKKTYFFFLILLLGFGGCTKDDLCSDTTQTTSLLVIEFRDITDRITAKSVQDLRIQINNSDSTEVVASVTDTLIAIPLNTEANLSSFLFTLNSTDETLENTDVVDFNYGREEVYLNRACAFKMVYTNLVVSVIEDSENWILDTDVVNPVVENENEAHITIYH